MNFRDNWFFTAIYNSQRDFGFLFFDFINKSFLLQGTNPQFLLFYFLAHLKFVYLKKRKLIKSVANALEKEGFIDEVKEEKTKISLRIVYRSKEPIISEVHLISKLGLRIYKNVEELEKIKGPFVYLISTPKGVISMQQAIKKRLGGEVL